MIFFDSLIRGSINAVRCAEHLPLGAHAYDGLRRRPDEHDALLRECFREIRILTQEPVP
jgi:hypothetical protein